MQFISSRYGQEECKQFKLVYSFFTDTAKTGEHNKFYLFIYVHILYSYSLIISGYKVDSNILNIHHRQRLPKS